jgi:hypothetical protein
MFAAWQAEPSHGAVTVPDTLLRGEPIPGGFFDPAIFGPLDGRARRWGHLDVPGVTFQGATLTRIPVPPIADRMPIAITDPAARGVHPGPINEAWVRLALAATRHRRLVELDAPAIILEREAEGAQLRFERVLALHGLGPTAPGMLTSWGAPLSLMALPPQPIADRVALLFLDEDRLLVQTGTECRIVTLEGHDLGPPFAPTGPDVSGIRGDLVVFAGRQRARVPERASVGTAVFDLATREYLRVADVRLPRYVLDEPPDEGLFAIDLMTGQDQGFDAAGVVVALAQTRDLRFVWAEIVRDDKQAASTIYEIATQRAFVEPPPPPPMLPITKLGKRADTETACSYDATLGWRLVDLDGAIGDGSTWWHRLVGATATAWSPTGSHLAALVGDELVILEVTPAAIAVESRAPLHVHP